MLVTIVAVFLSYNANSGLPFVPTYDLKANLPNAAQLVRGFEVRIGGARVGLISDIEPRKPEDGTTYAQVTMKLDKEIEPLPADSTLRVRPRSSLGLKYIEVTPGEGRRRGCLPGATIPLRQRVPRPWSSTRSVQHVRRAGAGGLAQLARRVRGRLRGPWTGPEHRDRAVRPAAAQPRAGGAQPVRPAHAASAASSAPSVVPPRRSPPWPRSRPRCS